MLHIKRHTSMEGLQRSLRKYSIGYHKEDGMVIFRTSKPGMPNCFLRGLVMTQDMAIVCAPFCTTTCVYSDSFAETNWKRAEEFYENTPGTIMRLYHLPEGWRYATKSNMGITQWNDGTPFEDIIQECNPSFDTSDLCPEYTYVIGIAHPKTMGYTPNPDNNPSAVEQVLGLGPRMYHITTYRNSDLIELPEVSIPGALRPESIPRPGLDGSRTFVCRVRRTDGYLYMVILGKADEYRGLLNTPSGIYKIVVEARVKEALEYYPGAEPRVLEMQTRIDGLIDHLVGVAEDTRANPHSVAYLPGYQGRIVSGALRAESLELGVARGLKQYSYEDVFPE